MSQESVSPIWGLTVGAAPRARRRYRHILDLVDIQSKEQQGVVGAGIGYYGAYDANGSAEVSKTRGTPIEEPLTESYEPPAVEERARINAPLKTVAQTERFSPRWRAPDSD
jgi:hypothetical protein